MSTCIGNHGLEHCKFACLQRSHGSPFESLDPRLHCHRINTYLMGTSFSSWALTFRCLCLQLVHGFANPLVLGYVMQAVAVAVLATEVAAVVPAEALVEAGEVAEAVGVEALEAGEDSGPTISRQWVSRSPTFKIFRAKLRLCTRYGPQRFSCHILES